jgi:hypothetical protein
MSIRAWLLCTALVPLVFATTSVASTICGTVTDRQSGMPIAHAGIFVRTPSGALTGASAATDSVGAFCIGNLAAGTYDLEVRVDDYRVAYLRGIQVTGPTIDVDVMAERPPLTFAPPAPNPVNGGTSTMRIRWTTDRETLTGLSIFDARGRRLRAWTATVLPAGEHAYLWNVRDAEGRRLAAGSYFIELDANGMRQVRRIVVLP